MPGNGELEFQEHSYDFLNDKRGDYTKSACTMCFMLTNIPAMWFMIISFSCIMLIFPPGSLKFWFMQGREYLCDQFTNKNIMHQVSNYLSGRRSLHTCCSNWLLEELSPCSVTPLREYYDKFIPSFLWTLHYMFPFC